MSYSVIYADPPWNQRTGRPLSGGYKKQGGKQVFNPAGNNSAQLPYQTMSVKAIADIPVLSICAPDAHLYLWVTNKYLMRASDVIDAWGFRYSTTLVWAKNAMGGGLGGNFKITTEFLLFCTRGQLKAKQPHTGTWFNEKRSYKNGFPCNSKKPEFFAELIEKVSPGPYLEMFARDSRPGWDVWGNEVENSIVL